MSTHIAEVVEVNLEKHPNADSLSIAKVKGWQVVVKTEDFQGVKLGVFIPIDLVVPDTEEWKWLENRRVKTHKFRGAISQGLLIPAEDWMILGQDVTEQLDITRYVPKVPNANGKLRGGYCIAPPPGMVKYTDIENYKNYTDVFNEGEPIVVTEKIHGANARFALLHGKFYVGSHNTVRRPIVPEPMDYIGKLFKKIGRYFGLIPPIAAPDTWQIVAQKYNIEEKMRWQFGESCDVILFGEIYGPHVQPPLNYGVPEGETHVKFFDLMVNDYYMSWRKFESVLNNMGLPIVPQIDVRQWGKKVFEAVDGNAFAGKHIREGIVVKPWDETTHPKLGRKVVKLVSEKFLLKDYNELPQD